MYSLCVIDMQSFFGVSPGSSTTHNVEREVQQAMKDGAAILFVEYGGCGDTLNKITDHVEDAAYPFRQFITKRRDDGSAEIIKAIKEMGYPDDHLKLVGVNTDCCVYLTAAGLRAELPNSKIEVIADACNAVGAPDCHENGIANIRRLGCAISNYNPVDPPPPLNR